MASVTFICLFFHDTDVNMTSLHYFVCCISHSFQLQKKNIWHSFEQLTVTLTTASFV